MKKCIKCGIELADNALFCNACGAKQAKEEKYCPNCGSPILEGGTFCSKCGTKQESFAKDLSQQQDFAATNTNEIKATENETENNILSGFEQSESEPPTEQISEAETEINEKDCETKQESTVKPASKKKKLKPIHFVFGAILLFGAFSFAAYKVYDHFEDKKLCNQIGDAGNAEDWQIYLDRFPHGMCSAYAQHTIGISYYEGKGVSQNYKTAVEWFTKAAEQNYATAQYNLGTMYLNGKGVEQNYEEAAKWFLKAAEQGNDKAQNQIGFMYDNGEGVEQNYGEAAKWFLKSAQRGNAIAQNNIGNMYYEGRGVLQNYEEAMKWYLKAAEQGSENTNSQNNIADMYYSGKGVSQNYKEAIKWFLKAAEQNNAYAQYSVGFMYYKGQGVKQDNKTAKQWLEKAKDQGYIGADDLLKKIKDKEASDALDALKGLLFLKMLSL